ncbi:Transposase [Shimia aestuarii]|uniref:Transposase n=1 Tax=Shimia aestuarii TaxID=254406 RepID=A0A1I4SJK4_9RHOB|nr:Transposase [Shimia aestuarii]
MKLFVGLDVSLAKTAVCVLTEHGKIMEEMEVVSEPEPLISLLKGLEGVVEAIGLEAGPLSQWLHRAMMEIRLPAVLMETRQVKGALKAMPIKTDRRDAEGIARLLHLGWFRPVHCKSVSAQEVRAILAARKAVQGSMIALEMSLRGLLRNFGLKVGAISRGRFEARIWRAGCLRRHHQGRRCEPQACPVSGSHGHAESRAWQRTSDMGILCCQTPREETCDGCLGPPHCCRVASYLG